jgi:hypothetical protein
MSRKIIVGLVAVLFSLGLCSVALAGDPDVHSTQFAFNSGMSGPSMSGSIHKVAENDDMTATQGLKPSMQEQKAQPCTLVLAKAEVNAVNSPAPNSACYNLYQDRIGS